MELFQLLKHLQQEIVAPSVENNIVEMALAGNYPITPINTPNPHKGAPLNQGVFLPIHIANGMYYRVLRVLPGDSFCLSSRDRVSFSPLPTETSIPFYRALRYFLPRHHFLSNERSDCFTETSILLAGQLVFSTETLIL